METSYKMRDLAIYIHIPFCKKKCNYCDFTSFSCNDENNIKRYVEAVIKEIKYYSLKTHGNKVKSVYFGGGTPSFIDKRYIVSLLDTLREEYVFDENIEITIEINPGTITKEKLESYKKAGINRISFGIQTLDDRLLLKIGRVHNEEDAINGYKLARELGFANISFDLMFGLPEQSKKDLEETIAKFIELNPEHISAYSLKVEENTVFGKLEKEGKLNLPTEDDERNMYYMIKEKLKENGYNQYEISNFSKLGFESRHNLCYWERVDYLGFGISASSCFDNKRFTNTDNLNSYIENPIENFSEVEVLSKEDIESERVFLGLRLLKGIDKELIVREEWRESVRKLEKQGLVFCENGKIKLTDRGLDLANQVFVEFV